MASHCFQLFANCLLSMQSYHMLEYITQNYVINGPQRREHHRRSKVSMFSIIFADPFDRPHSENLGVLG